MKTLLKILALTVNIVALCTPLLAFDAAAQVGGGGRGRGGSEGGPRQNKPPAERTDAKPTVAPVTDPMVAIERELPSLRIDLKLEREQGVLFDGFQRFVRDAADASRQRVRQLLSFKFDDGSTVGAGSIVSTIAEADIARGEAMRGVTEKMDALYNALNADQRRMFDRRIKQSQREPLGNS